MRADEQKPDTRRKVSDELASHSEVHIRQGHLSYIRRLCTEGCWTYPGRSALCPEIGTEEVWDPTDRNAEVSRGHSTCQKQGRPER